MNKNFVSNFNDRNTTNNFPAVILAQQYNSVKEFSKLLNHTIEAKKFEKSLLNK